MAKIHAQTLDLTAEAVSGPEFPLDRTSAAHFQAPPATVVPLDRLLPLEEVLRLTSWSRTSLYRKIADETFPRPIKIGAARIAFRASELTAWLDSRPRVYPHAA